MPANGARISVLSSVTCSTRLSAPQLVDAGAREIELLLIREPLARELLGAIERGPGEPRLHFELAQLGAQIGRRRARTARRPSRTRAPSSACTLSSRRDSSLTSSTDSRPSSVPVAGTCTSSGSAWTATTFTAMGLAAAAGEAAPGEAWADGSDGATTTFGAARSRFKRRAPCHQDQSGDAGQEQLVDSSAGLWGHRLRLTRPELLQNRNKVAEETVPKRSWGRATRTPRNRTASIASSDRVRRALRPMTLHPDPKFDLRTESELAALFDPPKEASLLKELDHVDANYAAWIAASPFFVLCTAGPSGLDASPRGDPKGFVRVLDPKTLLVSRSQGQQPHRQPAQPDRRSARRPALPDSRRR